MKRAIIIMAKAPVAGAVKTRLEPFLSPAECAELAAAFLRDAFAKAKTVCENTILAYSPAVQRAVLENILQSETVYVEQTGADLGERMSNAFEFAFASGSDAVVMIGTDSPTVPADFIRRAFEFLENESDVVLGETTDGGFYLIGLRKNYPKLFENVRWSSAQVFEQTMENAKRLKLRAAQIPTWYDVDVPPDLARLRKEILTGDKIEAPATFRWLSSHSELFGSGNS
ncbi:MAG: TIGR04282 family arsenosugar biosynthesis glycosyltransferase [Acidobacteriota bacterium]|nr:TIGR04282 family arsenosugar biosynthesis glycosyltransferase [Acidobacteriota bacterium]